MKKTKIMKVHSFKMHISDEKRLKLLCNKWNCNKSEAIRELITREHYSTNYYKS